MEQRDSKKEVVRLTFKNDELQERTQYMERRFHELA